MHQLLTLLCILSVKDGMLKLALQLALLKGAAATSVAACMCLGTKATRGGTAPSTSGVTTGQSHPAKDSRMSFAMAKKKVAQFIPVRLQHKLVSFCCKCSCLQATWCPFATGSNELGCRRHAAFASAGCMMAVCHVVCRLNANRHFAVQVLEVLACHPWMIVLAAYSGVHMHNAPLPLLCWSLC